MPVTPVFWQASTATSPPFGGLFFVFQWLQNKKPLKRGFSFSQNFKWYNVTLHSYCLRSN
jgi:hypothetical protein